MKQINSYLTFSGNCREAMSFYKECLGGELTLQTVGDSPLSGEMPERMRQCILHATLTNEHSVLMGTDLVANAGLIRGNAIAMMLDCATEEEARRVFEKLSSGGEILHPLGTVSWGALLGDLKDKYGNSWLLHYDKNDHP